MATAPRRFRPTLLLTVALLVAWLALASGHFCFPPFEKFLWKHWDYPKFPAPNPNIYCNKMMWAKGIFGKPKHIFIHEPIGKIKNVCSGGGIPIGGGWFQSKSLFHVTKCTWKHPHGPYTGQWISKKIVVRCVSGFPVDIQECMWGSHWGSRADGEQCESLESWSVPSSQYMAHDASSASEHWSEDSDVSTPHPLLPLVPIVEYRHSFPALCHSTG